MVLFPLVSHLLRFRVLLSAKLPSLAMAKYKTKTTHYRRPSRDGTVTFYVRRKYRMPDTTSQDCTLEIIEESFAFLPSNTRNPRIAVNFMQRLSYEGSFLNKPVLSVSAILPKDSEVFQLIKKGDLGGLIQSLSLRKAFVTDRDVDGRSLLNVSNSMILVSGNLN